MIADLKPYPAMKDSWVPWLGNVPAHWEGATDQSDREAIERERWEQRRRVADRGAMRPVRQAIHLFKCGDVLFAALW